MRLRTMHRVALALALVTAHASLADPARGQASSPTPSDAEVERARVLKQRGDEAMDALRYGDALANYQQVYAITQNPALLYNQGRAYQALGDFARAAFFLERFAAEAPPQLKARVPQLEHLLDDVRARVSKLTVHCNVNGAEVVLRDAVLGATPLQPDIGVTAGRATLKVRAEGYQPFEREIDLQGGGVVSIDVALVPRQAPAKLVIRANVPNAAVLVDEAMRGRTPIEVAVGAGAHAVRVEREGYEPARAEIALDPGERKELRLELSSPTPLYARWWFWTAVGVVAVSATVTVIALTSERSPDTGTLTPGRLSAPLVRW